MGVIDQLRQPLYTNTGTVDNPYGVPNTDRVNNHIKTISIDGNDFTDYKSYSFFWEKTLLEEPTRGNDGSMENLNDHAFFITPHLKITYSLMDMGSYRRLYSLILSKNEFRVTCFDTVNKEYTSHNMYFAPDSMPTLVTVGRTIYNGTNKERWVEVLGVKDYTIELIGTNTGEEQHKVTYLLNKPDDAIWNGETRVEKYESPYYAFRLGYNALVKPDTSQDRTVIIGEIKLETNVTENNMKKYYILGTWESDNVWYQEGQEYRFAVDKTFKAQWSEIWE